MKEGIEGFAVKSVKKKMRMRSNQIEGYVCQMIDFLLVDGKVVDNGEGPFLSSNFFRGKENV